MQRLQHKSIVGLLRHPIRHVHHAPGNIAAANLIRSVYVQDFRQVKTALATSRYKSCEIQAALETAESEFDRASNELALFSLIRFTVLLNMGWVTLMEPMFQWALAPTAAYVALKTHQNVTTFTASRLIRRELEVETSCANLNASPQAIRSKNQNNEPPV
jgi:hypothetical protein